MHGSPLPVHWPSLAFTLTLAGLATGGFGAFPAELVAFTGALLLVALFRTLHGPGPVRATGVPWGRLLLVALAIVLWIQEPGTLRLAAIASVVLTGAAAASAGGAVMHLVLVRALGCVAVWVWLTQTSADLYMLQERFSVEASRALSGLVGAPRSLGSTASGVPVLVMNVAALLSLAAQVEGRKARALSRTLLVFAVVHFAYLLASPWLGRNVVRPILRTSVPDFSAAWILFAVQFAALAHAYRSALLRTPPRRYARPGLGWLAGAAAVGVVLVPRPEAPPDSPPRERRALLYDKGYIAWDLPTFESFGLRSTGMFGLLPVYLESRGLSTIRGTDLTAQALQGVDLLVLINVQEVFSDEQSQAVWSHVSRGGALLVLGDHTGMAGIRDPFNKLLEPIRVEFNFDCAKPLTDTWEDQLHLFPSALAQGIKSTDQLPYGVGASLSVAQPARTVLHGLACWSDDGDVARAQEGFIGDFAYSPGETLGGLPLVAMAEWGQGRVLVFGDTSTFQNGSFASGERFIDNCLRWLLREDSADASRTRALLGVILLGVAFVSMWSSGKRMHAWTALTLLSFVTQVPWRVPIDVPRRVSEDWRVATIDLTHAQAVDDLWWRTTSIGGVHTNLLRNHLWVRVGRDFEADLAASDLLVLLPAGVRYSRDEIRQLRAFAEGGGVILASVGYDSSPYSRELVESFGFGIGSMPLGAVEAEALGAPILFRCAYPITASPADFIPFATVAGKPIAGWCRIGDGAFVLMADSHFLKNGNLEDRDVYVPENVTFLRSVIAMLRAEGLL